MLLALTGLTVLFSGSAWAPYVMNLLGGPVSAGILHRIGAVGFMGVFFIHLIYFAYPYWQELENLRMVRTQLTGPQLG